MMIEVPDITAKIHQNLKKNIVMSEQQKSKRLNFFIIYKFTNDIGLSYSRCKKAKNKLFTNHRINHTEGLKIRV